MVVLEAEKECLNSGEPKENLFFFRNSNGLEVDLVQKKNDTLNLFEIKSGKSLDKKFLGGMKSFRKHFCKNQETMKQGTVIYSGEDVPAFDGFSFVNYRETSSLFSPTEKKFRLEF